MKPLVTLILILTTFVTLSFLSSCGDASKKNLENAGENLKEAGADLNKAAISANEEARIKSQQDWQKFKNEADSTILAFEKKIKETKVEIAKANNKNKAKLNSELEKMEQDLNEKKEILIQKNAEFEADQQMFNESMVTKYESFRREFKHDNDELGTALKNLFRDNVQ